MMAAAAAATCVLFALLFHAAALVHPDGSDERDALALAAMAMLAAAPVVSWTV